MNGKALSTILTLCAFSRKSPTDPLPCPNISASTTVLPHPYIPYSHPLYPVITVDPYRNELPSLSPSRAYTDIRSAAPKPRAAGCGRCRLRVLQSESFARRVPGSDQATLHAQHRRTDDTRAPRLTSPPPPSLPPRAAIAPPSHRAKHCNTDSDTSLPRPPPPPIALHTPLAPPDISVKRLPSIHHLIPSNPPSCLRKCVPSPPPMGPLSDQWRPPTNSNF